MKESVTAIVQEMDQTCWRCWVPSTTSNPIILAVNEGELRWRDMNCLTFPEDLSQRISGIGRLLIIVGVDE